MSGVLLAIGVVLFLAGLMGKKTTAKIKKEEDLEESTWYFVAAENLPPEFWSER